MTQITHGRVKLAEYARRTWVAVAPDGATISDVLNPSFWSHVAADIRAWDRIEIRAEDDGWFADLVVFKATRLEVFARVLVAIDSDGQTIEAGASSIPQGGDASDPAIPAIPAIPAGYSVTYGGPVHKHRVIRTADSECLTHGLSKREAIQWAIDHAAGKVSV